MVKDRLVPEVTRATVFEWPQIEALRRAYFDGIEEPVQRRDNYTRWYVARIGERVTGCYSERDGDDPSAVIIDDFFVVPGRAGTFAAEAMQIDMAERADNEGTRLFGGIGGNNPSQLKFMIGRGWKIRAIILDREPRRET